MTKVLRLLLGLLLIGALHAPAYAADCDRWAVGTTSTSGATQLIAATNGQPVYVCSFFVNSKATTEVDAQLVYGTGTNCGTGTANFSLLVPLLASSTGAPAGQNVTPPPSVHWAAPASSALCLNLSASQAVNWQIHYHIGALY